eukprot:555802-Lingulodinium_polyedra.AAC.1
MRRCLDCKGGPPTGIASEAGLEPNKAVLRARAAANLTMVLQALKGREFGARGEREFRTLAESLDAFLAGDLGRCGD